MDLRNNFPTHTGLSIPALFLFFFLKANNGHQERLASATLEYKAICMNTIFSFFPDASFKYSTEKMT